MNQPQTSEPTVAQLFDLSDKVALITGASGWLGGAFSYALAEAGANVVVASRDETRAKAAVEALPVIGKAEHHFVAMDYMDAASIERGFQEALAKAGRVDILVNNGNETVSADLTTVTAEQFNRQIANATGYFLLARHVRDHAVQRGGGASIIMIGSMYSLVGSYPDAYAGVCTASPVAYHMLKGGVTQMTRHLAVYWARDGVRVNTLSPGPFPAPGAPRDMVDRLCAKSPMGRMGKPGELKGALVFLASEASTYVTGHHLVVDGGWTAW